MNKRALVIIVSIFLCGFIPEPCAQNQVKLETTFGDIVLELDSSKAPITVANFLSYVRKDFYKDIIFHRVIKNFMIQGGGHTADLTQKPTDPPIRNEAYNGLQNIPGAIAMARTSAPHSATSQFYINTVNNAYLNFKDSSSNSNWGYCVFGKVIEGMDVVDSIEKVETETVGSYQNVPKTPIVINNVVEITTDIQMSAQAAPAPSVTFHAEGTRLFIVLETERLASLRLYTLKGATIFTLKGITPGRHIVPLKNLAFGVYLFRIKEGEEITNMGVFLKQ